MKATEHYEYRFVWKSGAKGAPVRLDPKESPFYEGFKDAGHYEWRTVSDWEEYK